MRWPGQKQEEEQGDAGRGEAAHGGVRDYPPCQEQLLCQTWFSHARINKTKIVQYQVEIEPAPFLALVEPLDVEQEIQCENTILDFFLLYAIQSF